ncbi:MerR family transcriptional regulator [Streptomyces sp. NPDC000594]|uniref:MerR family transcriptional regulator n=1 Tax=Streptomyces sp. NPDC000594 TaxID=3154261 RepID=UPI003325CDBD
MRMSELGAVSGIPDRVIRRYAREGLLVPGERAHGRLVLIRALVEVGGHSLREVRAILDAIDAAGPPGSGAATPALAPSSTAAPALAPSSTAAVPPPAALRPTSPPHPRRLVDPSGTVRLPVPGPVDTGRPRGGLGAGELIADALDIALSRLARRTADGNLPGAARRADAPAVE